MAEIGRLLTAMVTPFDEAGRVDYARARQLAEALVAAGSEGLVVSGTTGESPTLTQDEKLRLFGEVREAVGERAAVIAGTCTYNTAESIELSREAAEIGVTGILGTVPYYNKPSQEGLYHHFMAVADASTRPVCLYNVPGRTAVNLHPTTSLRLAAHPNVMGIKEASGDLKQVMEILRQRPSGFAVLSGDDWLTMPVIGAGGDGLISVVSNQVPAAMTALVHLLLSGDLEKARSWHYRLMPLMDANFLETNPAPAKAALHLMGRIHDVLRLPLLPVSDATRAALRAALRTAGVADV
jgi:4-hydroxy-tetrahydrodipicolinate synthase